MAQDNPSNPFTRDPQKTQSDVPMPIQKAKVLSVNDHPGGNGYHSVRIRVYGEDSPQYAPVLAPTHGSVWVPKEGTDVAVVFGNSNKPWVIGSWYARDRVDDGDVLLREYEEGDIFLGNENGYVGIEADGTLVTSGSFGSYTDEDAQDAVGTILSAQFTYDDAGDAINIDPHENDPDAHHTPYSDADAIAAINNDADHGSTAQHDYYTDEEAQDAVGQNFDSSLVYDDGAPSFGVATDGIGLDEIDLSISPTWTSEHQFDAGIEIAEGQSIQDDGNVNRFEFASGFTDINDASGNRLIRAADTGMNFYARSGEPVRIYDEEASSFAVQYDTDATTGTLELTNSLLVPYKTTSDPTSPPVGAMWYRTDLD